MGEREGQIQRDIKRDKANNRTKKWEKERDRYRNEMREREMKGREREVTRDKS